MRLRTEPLTLKQANELIQRLHRHHKPVVGHRFSVGAKDDAGTLIGAAVVGRPVARAVSQYTVAEVTRLVTDGTHNACSFLYSACARASDALGFEWIQTYILDSESGVSLAASGWTPIYANGRPCGCSTGKSCAGCLTVGGDWNHGSRKGRRTDQPMCRKQRWGKSWSR